MSMAEELFDSVGNPKPDSAEGLSAAELDAKIHELTALQILRWFESGEMGAGEMQCVLRFLKDNDITALPIPESALERIKKKLDLPYPRMSNASDEAESPRSDD